MDHFDQLLKEIFLNSKIMTSKMSSAIINSTTVIRLKSYSTTGENSFIEVFEPAAKTQLNQWTSHISKDSLLEFVSTKFCQNKDIKEIPNWLQKREPNVCLSISQRLLCITIPLIEIRQRYNLTYRISVYLNSVMPVIKDIEKIANVLERRDEVIVNTKFSAELLQLFINNRINIFVNPPIPQLCVENEPMRVDYSIKEKSRIEISTFSRVIPDKQIHSVIEGLNYLDESYVLNIYGFQENEMTEIYLKKLIDNKNLGSKINAYQC